MSDGVIIDETGTQRTLGYVLDVSGGDGRARCRLTLDERHTNRHGAFHGGLAAVMLDNAMGATGSLSVDDSGLHPMVTLSLTTQFLASAEPGDELVAEGWLTGGGYKTKFIDGRITRSDGTIIATGTGVFKPRSKR
ncbi:Thioesterase superfamily protein [Rhodobacteraceae bacterium THAF1]|uniref:PaaI family thioesterase n=1 Tax=Palleronia sp. THAF1 TaxID=2587842 RepID=UPI000F3C7C22|nr:PaaI family thioesterase [Palleronia sp. THAF1]QFU08008.1 Thioesterase superfamily protein [Palleronia sp. THAF1]VDC27861.1 Thioesterase superfamily protein [Rhodobacteraceae bacterium THAF1]